MDLSRAELLRELVAETELGIGTTQFAHALRRRTTRPKGLLLFGPDEQEPWHLTAHLDEELVRSGVPDLRPSLVRWAPPADAPPHLAIGLDRFREVGRGESLLVVSEDSPAADLLERVDDVRRRGATIFTIDNGDPELQSLSHESLVPELLLPSGPDRGWITRSLDLHDSPAPAGNRSALTLTVPATASRETIVGFEISQHLVSLAIGDGNLSPAGWRARLGKLIDRLGGEPADE